MALFDEDPAPRPAPRPRRNRVGLIGLWALSIAALGVFVLAILPTTFVIQRPGPVFNTLGSAVDAEGNDLPLITVGDARTFPTAGALDLLTVQVVGNRERTPSWFEVALAWLDPTRAVVPLDSVFPSGQTDEERDAENSALMIDSQKEATAAALSALGHDVGAYLRVFSVAEGSAAEGILRTGDEIVAVDDDAVADVVDVRHAVNAAEGAEVTVTVLRGGQEQVLPVTPTPTEIEGDSIYLLGVALTTDYDFPIDVKIQLDNVGGPSAGMMFALGIIDELTAGYLNGGETVAGTGTISGTGLVGPIGGIRQKMWGALDAGAEWFLAPVANCGEVAGYVPEGLTVFAVETLDDALAALDTIREDGDVAALPSCTAG